MSDSYHYERTIRECTDPAYLPSIIEGLEDEIKRLEALRPIARARALYMDRNIRHYYRVTVFYHDSKHAGVYRPGKYDPALNRWLKDYNKSEVKGAHFSVRVDHRVYDNGVLFSDTYDYGSSLAFGPRDKGIVLEYVVYLKKLWGLTFYDREGLIAQDPEIRHYGIIMGSIWDLEKFKSPKIKDGGI